jgi:uncharacterized protein with ParB-like and HNH nuclease domain
MKVDKRTLREIFDFTERLEAPLFQRPFVWTKEKNWEPLWDGIRNVAERLANNEEARPHFLGAIVLDQLFTPTGTLSARQIIDGQQRLTTLQLALAAVRDLCRQTDQDPFERQFTKLTDNYVPLSKNAEDIFKVWPTNSDRGIFRAVMSAHSLSRVRELIAKTDDGEDPLIAEAYVYFAEAAQTWIKTTDSSDLIRRLDILREVFEKYLTLVVIDLGNDDDAQEIFETLNARGTPLLATDLVKNFLFHRAEKEGADVENLHRTYWEQFDVDKRFWRERIGQGRVKRPRLEWFLQYYLTLATNDEVLATELFLTFRKYVQRDGKPTENYLHHFKAFADIYRGFDNFPNGSKEGRFFYRLGELETTTIFPLLLEVFYRHQSTADRHDLTEILFDLESFLVRRQICQLTPKNYNRFFLDVIQKLRAENDFSAPALRSILLTQTVDTARWPINEEFARAWVTLSFYKKLATNRLRMVLEALDTDMQSGKSEKVEIKEKLTIEHLMPQDWETNWPLPSEIDPTTAKYVRDRMVHTIGNLTLVTKKLNPACSNGPWELKKTEITKHSAIAMNRRFHDVQIWNEEEIFERTKDLLQSALKVWGRPGTDPSELAELASPDYQSFFSTLTPLVSNVDVSGNRGSSTERKVAKVKLPDLFAVGKLRSGDKLTVRNKLGSDAVALDADCVRVTSTGEVMTWNQYGQAFTGHVAVNIYKQILVNGTLLGSLRE